MTSSNCYAIHFGVSLRMLLSLISISFVLFDKFMHFLLSESQYQWVDLHK